jgi:hypothetical protein
LRQPLRRNEDGARVGSRVGATWWVVAGIPAYVWCNCIRYKQNARILTLPGALQENYEQDDHAALSKG